MCSRSAKTGKSLHLETGSLAVAGEQLAMRVAVARNWGGKRVGAGRKPADPSARPKVKHLKRVRHYDDHPLHVTLRARAGLPSFRAERIHRMLTSILSRQQPQHRPRPRGYAQHFQVVHFSIQSNHIHLIVEAKKGTMRSGISGFAIAFAKRLNALLGARGNVWADRYHAHELSTLREVRNALVYCLQNYRKHGTLVRGPAVDMYSSALRFDGWDGEVITIYFEPLPEQPPWRPLTATTWMLRTGWKKHHPLVRVGESPA